MKLHWQILIALLLAFILGLMFPTSYHIDTMKVKELQQKQMPAPVLEKVQLLSDRSFDSGKMFLAELQQILGDKDFKKYKKQIFKFAYHNPFVDSVAWIGILFLRLLKMLIIPLIFSSLISGITNIQSGENLGKIMIKTFGYYVFTSFLAIITGLLLVNFIKPGIGIEISDVPDVNVEGLVDKQKSVQSILIDIVPDNILSAMVENQMLSIIFFAILFGFFITRVDLKYQEVLTHFFTSIFEVMMKLTMFVIKLTPIGIFAIVIKVIADQSNIGQLVSGLGLYMLTVILALSVHFFISLPFLTKLLAGVNPYQHMRNMMTPILTAFSTSSSGATLPLTMEAVEYKSGVSNKITSFTLPLGATINMDGTALYECVAAIFIAQAYGMDLSLFQQFVIVVTALLASIGAAAIPMAGLVMITVILTAVDLPLEGVGLILVVDRILDMFRTATNVWSDSNAAVIIAKSEGENLQIK
jgi:Na+/H+-dicarboxylate symporter